MPRSANYVPRYSKHEGSGLAVVTIRGKDHYLGPYGTKASHLEYDRLIMEWLAAGRPTPVIAACDVFRRAFYAASRRGVAWRTASKAAMAMRPSAVSR